VWATYQLGSITSTHEKPKEMLQVAAVAQQDKVCTNKPLHRLQNWRILPVLETAQGLLLEGS